MERLEEFQSVWEHRSLGGRPNGGPRFVRTYLGTESSLILSFTQIFHFPLSQLVSVDTNPISSVLKLYLTYSPVKVGKRCVKKTYVLKRQPHLPAALDIVHINWRM